MTHEVPGARGSDLPSAQAARLRRPRWLDVRLLLGVLLVLGSVVLGAKVIAEADDTYPVWALTHDLGPQYALTDGDLVAREVRIVGAADRYLAATGAKPVGWVLTRSVGAGELLPRAAVAATGSLDVRRMAVGVDRVVAGDLAAGASVDVYVIPTVRPGEAPKPAELVLRAVTVARVADAGRGLGSSASESSVVLLVGGSPPDTDGVRAVLDAQARGRIQLVQAPRPAAAAP